MIGQIGIGTLAVLSLFFCAPSARAADPSSIGRAVADSHAAPKSSLPALKHGTYVSADTPCAEASAATLINFDGTKFLADRACWTIVGGSTILDVKICGAKDASHSDQIALNGEKQFTVRGAVFRYCSQQSLPVMWRNQVEDASSDNSRPPYASRNEPPFELMGIKLGSKFPKGAIPSVPSPRGVVELYIPPNRDGTTVTAYYTGQHMRENALRAFAVKVYGLNLHVRFIENGVTLVARKFGPPTAVLANASQRIILYGMSPSYFETNPSGLDPTNIIQNYLGKKLMPPFHRFGIMKLQVMSNGIVMWGAIVEPELASQNAVLFEKLSETQRKDAEKSEKEHLPNIKF